MANSQVKQDRPWGMGSILDMWLGVIIESGLVVLRKAILQSVWLYVGRWLKEVSNCLDGELQSVSVLERF